METIKKLNAKLQSLEDKIKNLQTENSHLKASLLVKPSLSDETALMKSQKDEYERQASQLKIEVTKLKAENAGFRNGTDRLIANVKQHTQEIEEYKKRLLEDKRKNHEKEIENTKREDHIWQTYENVKKMFIAKTDKMNKFVEKEIRNLIECYNELREGVNNSQLIKTELATLIKKHPLFFMEVINSNPKVLINRFEEFFRPLWLEYRNLSFRRMSELEDLILLQDKQKKRN